MIDDFLWASEDKKSQYNDILSHEKIIKILITNSHEHVKTFICTGVKFATCTAQIIF